MEVIEKGELILVWRATIAACAAYATIRLNNPDMSQKCVPKLECRGAPAVREKRFHPPGLLVPLFSCFRKTKPAVISMSKARPAVAVCRAKIACTMLVALVIAIVRVDRVWVPQGQFVMYNLCLSHLRIQLGLYSGSHMYAVIHHGYATHLTMTDGCRQKRDTSIRVDKEDIVSGLVDLVHADGFEDERPDTGTHRPVLSVNDE